MQIRQSTTRTHKSDGSCSSTNHQQHTMNKITQNNQVNVNSRNKIMRESTSSSSLSSSFVSSSSLQSILFIIAATTTYYSKEAMAFTLQNNHQFVPRQQPQQQSGYSTHQTSKAAARATKSLSFAIKPQRRNIHHHHQRQTFSYPNYSMTSSILFSEATEQEGKKAVKTGSSSGGKADETEWKTLVLAFQMYKAAYGDLKVPSRFVVPSMAPWPGK